MIASYQARHFQLWEYKVSHGSLLVRSPRRPTIPTNIDLFFVGVEFVMLPRHLEGVELMHGTLDDVKKIRTIIGHEVPAKHVFVFLSSGNRFHVVATTYKLDQNEGDIFGSPFA